MLGNAIHHPALEPGNPVVTTDLDALIGTTSAPVRYVAQLAARAAEVHAFDSAAGLTRAALRLVLVLGSAVEAGAETQVRTALIGLDRLASGMAAEIGVSYDLEVLGHHLNALIREIQT